MIGLVPGEPKSRTPFDYHVYIDTNDDNVIKAKNCATGLVEKEHDMHADIPLQYAIDQLFTGSVLKPQGIDIDSGKWVGGRYGTVYVGPGTYYVYSAIILRSGIWIQGSGSWATRFMFPDNLYSPSNNNNALDVFKSASWDANSIGGGTLPSSTLGQGEYGVYLCDFEIFGNFANNQIPAVNTATTYLDGSGYETAGRDSWGHGIAYYAAYNAGSLVINNLMVHGCPGAGIIVQGGGGVWYLGGLGYPYPMLGSIGSNQYGLMNQISNLWCTGNGRQGLLIRTPTYLYNYWSYANGEAGIDIQECAYFQGYGWIDGIACFIDGANHPNAVNGNTSTTYDPLGFEVGVRSSAGTWMSNTWIEAPFCCGDNLLIGDNGTAAPSPTGYQLHGNGGLIGSNMMFDSTRANTILVGPHTSGVRIRNALAKAVNNAPSNPGLYNNITPLKLLAAADVELGFIGFNASFFPGGSVNGVIIGNASPSVFCWGYNLMLYSSNNDYVVDNQNASNYGRIEATLVNTTAGTKYFLKPGGQQFDYRNNPIRVSNIAGGTAERTRSMNGGTATLTGDGATTTFIVAHLLFATPTVVETRAKNPHAANGPAYYMTADATNIIFNFVSAPATGSLTYWWSARVSP